MKKTNEEIIVLNNALMAVGGLTGVKFAHAVAKNISILKPEINALQESLKDSDEFAEYNKKREELAKEHAVKENGAPKVEGNQYVMENKEAFDKAFAEFKKDYKSPSGKTGEELVTEKEKQFEEYKKLLKEEVELELYQIGMADIPETISAGQMNGIFTLIKD